MDAQYAISAIGGYNFFLVSGNGNCLDTSSTVYIMVNNCMRKEANVWYFGNYAGLDFNSGNPVALTNSAMSAAEGCASIADVNGNLLFYTNGNAVWNKNHLIMMNGLGLYGDASATQSAIIVPQPENDSIYFIFTVDSWGGGNGLNYSVVNMNLQGGTGGVVLKNVQLITESPEKITAVKHCNNSDIWVIGHQRFTNAFNAYLVTSAGITGPVISNVGSVNSGSFEMPGQLKASPAVDKIVSAVYWPNRFELFDFDNSTGIISNPVTLNADVNAAYGAEFSPDGSKLYLAYEISGPGLFQFDLEADNITTSFTLIGTSSSLFESLQLAVDGRIYIVQAGKGYLSAIANPNATGIACNYIDSSIYLAGKKNNAGLPSIIQSFFFTPKPQIMGKENLCIFTSDTFFLQDLDQCMVDSTIWKLSDSIISIYSNDSLVWLSFTDTGTYNLIAEITTICSTVRDTFTFRVHGPPQIELGNDTALCIENSITLNPGSGYSEYLWQDGSTDSIFISYSTGNLWVRVTDSLGCEISDSVEIVASFPPPPSVSLGNDTAVCSGNIITMDAGANFLDYHWNDGSSSRIFTSYLPGIYSVTVSDVCNMIAVDSIVISEQKKEIFLNTDTSKCENDTIVLDAGPTYLSYFWNDGSTNQFFQTDSFGKIYVLVTDDKGCSYTDTFVVSTMALPPLNIGNDTLFCPPWEIALDAGPGFASYLWQDNSTARYYYAGNGGVFSVTVTDICNIRNSDSILVSVDSATCYPGKTMEIINVFTPNGDGVNDVFIVKNLGPGHWSIYIFNRWGELLFYLDSPQFQGWTGKNFAGAPVPDGVYFYILKNDSGEFYRNFLQLSR